MKCMFILNLAAAAMLACSLSGCQSANADKATPVANDAKQTEGTWTLVSWEENGEPKPEDALKNCTLTIVGDNYTVQLGDEEAKTGTQKLDATTSPKQIDAEDTAGPTPGKMLGIYEFTTDGNFRVCFDPSGATRPTEFVTEPGSGHFIHVWQRADAK